MYFYLLLSLIMPKSLRHIKILSYLIFAFVYSYRGQAQSISGKPDRLAQEVKSWISTSKFKDAPKIGDQFSSLWGSKFLSQQQTAEIQEIVILMPKNGFRTPNLAYFFIRNVVQIPNDSPLFSDFIAVWKRLLVQKDAKTAMVLAEQLDSWFYTKQLIQTGNLTISVQGNLRILWPTIKTKLADTLQVTTQSDGWDTESPLSDAPMADFYDEQATWLSPSQASDGPRFTWEKPEVRFKIGKDSLRLESKEFSWLLKDKFGIGTDTDLGGAIWGIPNSKLALNEWEILPRSASLLGIKSLLSMDGKANEGMSKISLKRKTGAPNFNLEFRSNENIKEPIVGAFGTAKGRLWIQGNKLGLLASREAAQLEILKNKKIIARVLAPSFWISPEGSIDIPKGSFVTYIGVKDSLYHPLIRGNWYAKDQTLHIKKLEGIAEERLLFEDSYHQIRISADLAILKRNTDRIDFYRVSGKSQVPAWIESFDYYSPDRIEMLQGTLTFNPMRVLYNFLIESKRNWAYFGDILEKNNKEYKALMPGFNTFIKAGYIQYDPKTDIMSFTKMGRHYAQVQFAKKDFDKFFVASNANQISRDSANISIDIAAQKLIVRGVKEVTVSDSLKANFIPSDRQIVFSKGRDFDFKGEIKIGNYRFRGPLFDFNFSNFSVNFKEIDSITFLPKLKDGSLGNRELGGQFKYGAGTILLSPPNNKSGRLGVAEYPKLIIPTGVISYFNEPWRAKGVYGKEFYFKVPRIELDSLTQKEITFEGSFYTDGLMPTLRVSLVLMPDQSFGFKYTSKLPLDLYKKQAKYIMSEPLLMDKLGLHASGSLQVLSLTSYQKSTYFYPDSLISSGTEGKIASNYQGKNIFPETKWAAHLLSWRPSQDSLWVKPIKNQIAFYQNQVRLDGQMGVHNKKVFARGKLVFGDGVFVSNHFNLAFSLWQTNQSEMRIGRQMSSFKPAIFTKSITAEANLLTQKVSIKPSSETLSSREESPIIFPYIAYQSILTEALWDLKAERFKMFGKSGFELSRWLEDSTSTSLDSTSMTLKNRILTSAGQETQGSIKAFSAEYDLKAQFLQLGGVQHVAIGAAFVFPSKGLFAIQKDGQFKPFSGARALLDPLNNLHKLSDLRVIEANSDAWKGEANYLLPRSDGDTVAIPIKNFEFLKVENPAPSSAKTKSSAAEPLQWVQAEGLIPEKSPILLSEHQQYKGEVNVVSKMPFLKLKGFIRPLIGLKNFRSAWIPFENAKGESANLRLDANLRDEAGRPVTAGIFINADNKLYPTFLGPFSDELDPVLFSAEGEVNEGKESYEVKGKSSELRLFIDQKRMEANGPVQLFTGNEGIKSFGKINLSTDTLSPRIEAWLSIQYPIPATVLKVMGDRIVKYNLDEGYISTSADEPEDRDEYLKRVEFLLKKPLVDPIRTKMDQAHLALDKVSPEFAKNINFSKVHWAWSANTSSFYSLGGLPLVNVGPVDINSTVKGYMEVIKKPNKEEFYGYWELSEDLWYYFAYFNGELGVFSSDNQFLAAIREAVKNEKVDKKDKDIVRVVEAAADEKETFLKRFLLYYRQTSVTKKAVNAKKQAPVKEAPKSTKPKTKQGGF